MGRSGIAGRAGKSLAGFIFFFAILARAEPPGALDITFHPSPGTDGPVNSVSVQPNGKVIIGGAFTHVNGVPRNRIARLNVDGTLDSTFDPGSGPNDDVFATAVQPDGKIIVAGRFSTINGFARSRIARLNAGGAVDQSFDPGAAIPNNFVLAVAIQPNGRILVGGLFNRAGVNNITRLLSNGAVDLSFNPGVGTNGRVFSVRVQGDGRIVIGGWFTVFNGKTDGGVERLNSNGSADGTFNPGTSSGGNVFVAVPQPDGKIFLGGRFLQVSGINRNYLARLNENGSVDTSFAPAADSFCTTAELQLDGKIVIGGLFSAVNGVSRNRIARLNRNGTLNLEFDPGTGFTGTLAGDPPEVRSLKVEAIGRIVTGGAFTFFNNSARMGIARLIGTPFGMLSGVSADARVRGAEKLAAVFVMGGSENKTVLLRALGPSAGFAVPLMDPTLELFNSNGELIARNNNWKDDQQGAIAATGWSPGNEKESAILINLAPGTYRAVVRARGRTKGRARWELIDVGTSTISELASVSARGFAGGGANGLSLNVTVGGATSETKLLFRGLGPSLSDAVSDPLRNPVLEFAPPPLSNDDWRDSQENAIERTGLAPDYDREAALITNVTPGSYSATVHGKRTDDVGTGAAEVFVLPGN